MFGKVIAAGAVAIASAQVAPTWPKEFQTELTVVDTRRNHTEQSDYSFSVSNVGTQDDFTRFRNISWVTFHDYKDQVMYDVIQVPGQPQCREQPERGQLPIPPVNTFVYNGTVTLPDGTQAYRFNDPQFHDLEYLTTADTNENPIAFYDRRNGIAQEFRNFQAVTTWPTNFWAKPAGCK